MPVLPAVHTRGMPDGDLGAEDRTHGRVQCAHRELHRPTHRVVIGQCERGMPELTGAVDQLLGV